LSPPKPQSLSPTEPILPQIEAAVIAGHSISVDVLPAAATHPPIATQGEEIGTVTGGPSPPRVNVINTNGGLQGHAPVIFDGDRKKSKGFLLAFQLYQKLNQNHAIISNPFSRVLTALTFIEGDQIDSWKENKLEKLTDRVTSGVPETSELHWQIFKDSFSEAFTNTNEKQEAYQNLTCLKQGDSLDYYVVEFK
jgi:hypothetical protein